ncbi:MAG: ribonuclease Y [Bacilli bacterium]
METVINQPVTLILVILCSLLIGFLVSKSFENRKIRKTGISAQSILENAEHEADKRKRNALVEAKEDIHRLKMQSDKEIKEKKQEYLVLEEKHLKREEIISKREENLHKRESVIEKREDEIKDNQHKIIELEKKVEKKLDEQEELLHSIAKLSKNEAKKKVMEEVEENMTKEIVKYMKEEEEKAKRKVDKKAQMLLANSIQRYASDVTNEVTVTTVGIPNEDVKGRIIGREGRNIRTFEALTGVDLIIDDTPDAVVLSGYDPIRRETAKIVLEKLIKEGRINPTRIEEVVKQVQKEMDSFIMNMGEEAAFELGIGNINSEITRLLGCLHFRTSYGQSVLQHSKEVAFLSGLLAAEIGEDQVLAKRAGLLHDIGKAIDHEAEGSHVELGIEFARRYKEDATVLNAIASHHGNVEPNCVISVLVAAADALSAARPGARSDSLENYIKRLEQLEKLTESFDGVDSAYALQAGREVRVVVNPKEINDDRTYLLAKNIKTSIEDNLQYPGTIKVVVVRETRACEEAK